MNSAYGPIAAALASDPPAPVNRASLTRRQQEALVLIFFAGEMNRSRQFFIADGSTSILGTTVDALHRKGLVKLGVERRRRADGSKIFGFRYYTRLTDRGEWYATTLIHRREMFLSALSPAIAPDNFEDSPNVYAAEEETT